MVPFEDGAFGKSKLSQRVVVLDHGPNFRGAGRCQDFLVLQDHECGGKTVLVLFHLALERGFGVAARLMRQILVDQARRRASAKRGSHPDEVSIENAVTFSPAPGRAIEQLDDALNALAAQDPRKAEIIELRYFGGFGLEEIGRSLSISAATVCREQRIAEAWLHREIARATGAQE